MSTKFVLLEGGIVANDLDIPVYNLDSLDAEVTDGNVEDIADLIANIFFDGNNLELEAEVVKAADTLAAWYFRGLADPNTVRINLALHEIQGLRDGIGDYASDRYHPVRVFVNDAIVARVEKFNTDRARK